MRKGVTETRVNYLKATWALCQYEALLSTRDANSQPTVCVALSTHQKVETCNVTPFNSIHKQLFPSQQDLNRLTKSLMWRWPMSCHLADGQLIRSSNNTICTVHTECWSCETSSQGQFLTQHPDIVLTSRLCGEKPKTKQVWDHSCRVLPALCHVAQKNQLMDNGFLISRHFNV